MFKSITIFLTLLVSVSLTSNMYGQALHTIDFEPEGVGQDFEWTVDQNGTNPALAFIANPDPTGGNTSETVAQFTAEQAGQTYALFFTDSDGQFTFDAENSMVKIMVHKPVMSNVTIKFEGIGVAPIEIAVENTTVNAWEELTYDFSEAIGRTYNKLIIIPDFVGETNPRTEDRMIYIDNIIVPDGEYIEVPEPEMAAPTPEDDQAEVISIFSDAFDNLEGSDFNPGWGQSTLYSTVDIEGNQTILLQNLNYQGIQLASGQDLSGMKFLHIDYWTPNSTAFGVKVVKASNAAEARYDFSVSTEQWVSVDIPLTQFSSQGLTLDDIHQVIFDGNGTVYIDNIYFRVGEPVLGNEMHTIDFEPDGVGQDFTWTVDENDDDPDLEFIDNPDPSGANTSPTVAKFTARAAGNPWALFFTSDDGEFTFGENNSMVKIMVHKSRISNVAIKFEGGTSPAKEIAMENTTTGAWEELTFDFSEVIGNTYGRIVIIPDNAPDRTEDLEIYIDNIVVPDGEIVEKPAPTEPAPTPDESSEGVISIFSDQYDNLEGTEFNPSWGQSTSVSEIMIGDDNVLKYEFLNYQGTQLAAAQDLTGMNYMHVDFWTNDATALAISLIKEGQATPQEFKYDFTIENDTWVSVDIPMSHFTDNGLTVNDIHQLKVDGNGNVYFDNIYFMEDVNKVEYVDNDNPLFTLHQNYPNPFRENTQIRFELKESNNVELKVYDMFGQEVTALANGMMMKGSHEINFDAQDLGSGQYFVTLTVGNLTSTRSITITK